MPEQFLPFLAIVALLTLTPGPDMALVIRNGVRGGVQGAWMTGLGCCTGIAGYAAASTVGLAALLAASATAFAVVKLAGAAYLIYLGCKSLLHARTRPTTLGGEAHVNASAAAAAAAAANLDRRQAFRQGLMSNLLNPKIALIFITLIPTVRLPRRKPVRHHHDLGNLLPDHRGPVVAGLLASHRRAGRVLWRERVRVAIDRVTCVVLIALGIRVATSSH